MLYQKLSKLFLVAAVLLALAACASTHLREKQLINSGAKRMNAEQVTEYLSGNTQQWENGGAYFLPDGAVYVKWGGKVYPERRWVVDDDGRVCIVFLDGVKSSCSSYFMFDGKVWVVTLEIFGEAVAIDRPIRTNIDGSVDPTEKSVHGGPDTILKGNRLDEV